MAIQIKIGGVYVNATNVYVKKNADYQLASAVSVKVGTSYATIFPTGPGVLGGNFTPQFASNGAAIFA